MSPAPGVTRNLSALRRSFCLLTFFFNLGDKFNLWELLKTLSGDWISNRMAQSHLNLQPHGDRYLTCDKDSKGSFRVHKMTLEIKRGEGQKGRLEGFFGVTGSRACSVGNYIWHRSKCSGNTRTACFSHTYLLSVPTLMGLFHKLTPLLGKITKNERRF